MQVLQKRKEVVREWLGVRGCAADLGGGEKPRLDVRVEAGEFWQGQAPLCSSRLCRFVCVFSKGALEAAIASAVWVETAFYMDMRRWRDGEKKTVQNDGESGETVGDNDSSKEKRMAQNRSTQCKARRGGRRKERR